VAFYPKATRKDKVPTPLGKKETGGAIGMSATPSVWAGKRAEKGELGGTWGKNKCVPTHKALKRQEKQTKKTTGKAALEKTSFERIRLPKPGHPGGPRRNAKDSIPTRGGASRNHKRGRLLVEGRDTGPEARGILD